MNKKSQLVSTIASLAIMPETAGQKSSQIIE